MLGWVGEKSDEVLTYITAQKLVVTEMYLSTLELVLYILSFFNIVALSEICVSNFMELFYHYNDHIYFTALILDSWVDHYVKT